MQFGGLQVDSVLYLWINGELLAHRLLPEPPHRTLMITDLRAVAFNMGPLWTTRFDLQVEDDSPMLLATFHFPWGADTVLCIKPRMCL